MHCPNCGTEAPVVQKFCRSCGLSLDPFSKLLAELMPSAEDENVAEARRRLRDLERVLKITGTAAMVAIAILFAMAGVFVMRNHSVGGGFFLLGIGVFLITALLVAYYQSSLTKKIYGRPQNQPELPSAETTNKLLSDDQPQIVMSVAEPTTARLEEKLKSRP
jgi:ABC-type bacteriocin/lantibiotic exporter with double-glycine peptidase domain